MYLKTIDMSTEEVMNLIDEHLQEANSNTEERINRTKELLRFLNYNLRLAQLTDEEKEDFIGSMEGYPLTKGMRETLDKAENEQVREHYIDTWARSTYFKQCEWLQYLYGETEEKPFTSEKKAVA